MERVLVQGRVPEVFGVMGESGAGPELEFCSVLLGPSRLGLCTLNTTHPLEGRMVV